MNTTYRQELKYRISAAEKETLISRLSAVLQPDTHADANGRYVVRTLYFDDINDTAMTQSLNGQPQKTKYRVRMYNGDPSFIRLERKVKHYSGSCKTGECISPEECQSLIRGEYDYLLRSSSPFLNACYADFTSRLLRPKIVVQYTRHAFICPQDAIRITIDENVAVCSIPESFSAKSDFFGISVFENRQCVLEVKYTHYMPDYVLALIGVIDRTRVSTSKYVAGRLIY